MLLLVISANAQQKLTVNQAIELALENNYGIKIVDNNKEIAKNNLQKRVIQTSEIAEQICWLALNAPVSLTGEDIRITGGELW